MEQINLWYNDVDFIPEIALDWIFKELKSQDTVPRNIPKAFISQWYSYRKANPDKTVADYEYCPDCLGHGIHLFEKLEDMYYPAMLISYVAMCAACDNWKKEFGTVAKNGGKLYMEGKPIGGHVPKVPRGTRQQLIDLGFKYLPFSDPNAKRVVCDVPEVKLKEIPKTPNVYEGPREEVPF
ncbi:unnamed protein product [marine sediment metagenome]|uniref:Uncharacterized protein n=1 Tax=marine sediment metagenome TaxID=412755 RepID=X0VDY9_9ZZZZ